MRRSLVVVFLIVLHTLFSHAIQAATTTAAAAGDASIVHDDGAGTWTLGAGGTSLKLSFEGGRDFAIASLTTASGRNWAASNIPDSLVKVGSQTLALGSRAAGFVFQDVTVSSQGLRLQLNITWNLSSAGLRVTRHYTIVSGSPSFEAWTTFTPTASATLFDLNALQIVVPNGAIHTLTGLDGDNADVASDSAFTLKTQTAAPGQHLSFGAQRRSSEQTVPWIAVDGPQDEFYAAVMWSGAWTISADRTSNVLALNFGLPAMTTTAQGPVDTPHAVFGVAPGGLPQATAALRSYAIDGIRAGRPIAPHVTYNTWFAYGTDVTESSMRDEMAHTAALGAELFVLDAGWYAGTGVAGPFDFDAGLGSWAPDPVRFPNGLAPLRDYAHGLGMKFGLWVEPERINQSLIGGRDSVDERLLATTQGEYGSEDSAQVCLGTKAARDWILGWLTGLIDQVQPDYLKWDNNLFVNCDRGGHDHGAADGNFAHVNGLYAILDALRQRYPSLLIENVSGGGNRLDLGMLRYTDVAWMDDRTAPSVHVRHNVEGLATVFPPAYLLSFVTDHDTEPLHDSPDLSLYFRSRMPGALGLCFRTADLAEGDLANMSREVGIYKAIRGTLQDAAGSLLTPQAADAGGPAWDVMQETTAGSDQVVVCAFQSNDTTTSFVVKPTGLDAQASYEVTSVDTGVLGTATGAEIMSSGIDVLESPNTAAHILIIKAQ
jgi:alpha-galactosidase